MYTFIYIFCTNCIYFLQFAILVKAIYCKEKRVFIMWAWAISNDSRYSCYFFAKTLTSDGGQTALKKTDDTLTKTHQHFSTASQYIAKCYTREEYYVDWNKTSSCACGFFFSKWESHHIYRSPVHTKQFYFLLLSSVYSCFYSCAQT